MWACCDLDAELMESLPEKRWCVVGGADKGILVRQGQELSSPEASARLARGALVRQVSLVGDRLSFAKLMGEGPDTGWVSIKIKDKILMELAPVLEPKAVPGREAKVFVAPPAKVEGRKPRALCLHGTAATEKVLRAQLMPLLKLAGDDIEFLFQDGCIDCDPKNPIVAKQIELMTQYFPGEKFKQWAEPSGEDGGWRRYEGWEQALRFAQEAMNKLQPDVLLGFSQGSNLAHPLAAQAALGRGHPLHCVVHFCTTKPGWVAQTPELFEWQIPVPALLIAGKLDETATGSSEVASSYADPAVLSHSAL
ncbi:unnamed protein product [Effrenium voratum]|uniref:Serine hydrolase domain-containing protein n=1 Tax=Effrenium voratum TaxID=2562239 RepID=A0AA36HRG8_9DINO|nr:unnamed protein product [Effrenium voratum]CAJ1373988.1 unnamed protein product [Effrenium voratum]CAJ1423262.1 unnamed protein product [Effrenium voratum]